MIQRTVQVGNTRIDIDVISVYGPYKDSDDGDIIMLLTLNNGVNFHDMGVTFKTIEERDAAIVELDRYFKK